MTIIVTAFITSCMWAGAIVMWACIRIGAQADDEEQHSSYQEPHPMTGLWATLTPEQKAKARNYRGNENFGGDYQEPKHYSRMWGPEP